MSVTTHYGYAVEMLSADGEEFVSLPSLEDGTAVDGTIMHLHLRSKRTTMRKNECCNSMGKISVSAAFADTVIRHRLGI
jgi:hypothetical protein